MPEKIVESRWRLNMKESHEEENTGFQIRWKIANLHQGKNIARSEAKLLPDVWFSKFIRELIRKAWTR